MKEILVCILMMLGVIFPSGVKNEQNCEKQNCNEQSCVEIQTTSTCENTLDCDETCNNEVLNNNTVCEANAQTNNCENSCNTSKNCINICENTEKCENKCEEAKEIINEVPQEETAVQEQETVIESKEEVLSESQKVYKLINEERRKQGVAELEYRSDIQAVSDTRAEEITRLFSHTRPDGRSFYTAARDNNISYRKIGENIAYGSFDAEGVMKLFMNSSGHRANILSADYTGVAVAFIEKGNTKYCVQTFIRN